MCGGVLNDTTGWLMPADLNNDGSFDDHLICTWHILAERGNVIQLELQTIDIDETSCNKEFLRV